MFNKTIEKLNDLQKQIEELESNFSKNANEILDERENIEQTKKRREEVEKQYEKEFVKIPKFPDMKECLICGNNTFNYKIFKIPSHVNIGGYKKVCICMNCLNK